MLTTRELLSDPAHGLIREVRQPQLQMATSVEDVITNGGVYVAEGPVGSGKTYSYLVPALLAAGRRVVVATAKKSLQDQIESKDLPKIAGLLGVVDGQAHALTTGAEGQRYYLSRVIKGKSNYICKLLAEKKDPDATFRAWLQTSRNGDRATYPGAAPKWWGSATAEECVGRACKNYSSCGYTKLKQDILQTRLLVVNHHLLGSDMYYGLGKLVGGAYDILVVDEAHKLAEGIRSAFTLEVSENALHDLEKQLSETPFIFSQPRLLQPRWAEMFAALPNRNWRDTHSRTAPVFPEHSDACMEGLKQVDNELARNLESYGIKGNPGEATFWDGFAQALEELGDDPDLKSNLVVVAMSRRKIDGMDTAIRLMQGLACRQQEDEDDETWRERNRRFLDNTVIYGYADRNSKFHLKAAPIHVGAIARSYLSQVKSVIITSATLAVDGSFDHLNDVLGVTRTREEILPTTFNYNKQGLAFIPKDVPVVGRQDPTYGDSIKRRVEYCEELIELSQGGAFILTTANDELDMLTEALQERLKRPVFAQGDKWDGEPAAVLQKFRAAPNSVLIGSKSFWEGVDIVGEQLRLVILTKMPFPNPRDPFIMARSARYKRCMACRCAVVGSYGDCPGCGGDLQEDTQRAWQHVSYVDMMIDLRQGVGRLIRSITDRGMVAVLDSRIWTRKYGKQVRQALQFPVTSDMEDCRFALPRIVSYYQKRRGT